MKTFVNAFLEQANINGSRPAVMDCRGADTYREMDRMSAALARMILDTCAGLGTDVEALRREGKSGARIGLLLPRTRRFFVAELAVLRAGCAAVPMDAAYPEERIRTILEDAGCPLCITTGGLAEKVEGCPVILLEDVDAALREAEPDCSLNWSDPDIEGLLIFTSGSTGKPKGVIHRQAIFSHSYEMLSSFHTFTPKDVTCCRASFTFIAAIIDPMPPLMTGGSVYVTNDAERRDAALMQAIVKKRHITGMSIQPVMFQIMRDQYGRLPLDWVLMGGEKTKTKYADDGNLLEIYASSEAFTVLTHFMKSGEDAGMLGKPAAGARVYLLDDDGNRIETPGEIGELCVVSPWIMMGYNNLPEETAKKITPCPFEPGERMYHTGDYMAFDGDGNLIFHGRKDRMVKVRSYRIELGEIENVMNRFPGIKESACVAVRVHGGDKLCCYYTGEETDPAALRAHASAFLTEYMVPDYFVRLDRLPRNDRGKVQYLELQALEPPAAEENYTAPETPLEERVCAAFASTLDIPRVSVLADFFELGGTSLTVSVLIHSLGDIRTGLSFQDVVQHPTPRQLAAFLENPDSRAAGRLPMDREAYPLTKTQMGIYLEGLTGGNSATYTVPILVKADPSVGAERLIAAVKAVLSAHPAMKYVIRAGADQVPHIVMVPDAPVDIPVVDGTEEDRLAFMQRFVPVVPMLDGLLFHFAVYRTAERCYLAIKSHLIFLDGTSVNLLIAELNRALTGKDPVPEELCIQQVGMLEERMMQDGTHEAARKYYLDLFKAMEDIPPLSGDLDGVLVPGESENLRYEPGTLTSERVKAFCEKNQITESSFFMGAMGLMLGKYLNTKHVSFSTVYNGRALGEMKNTIGTLIKRIPVYAGLSRDLPVGDYLREMGRQVLANMSHDIYSFDEVLKECPVNEDVEFIFQGSQFTDVAAADASDTLVEGDKWFIEQYHTGMVTGCLSIQFFATAGLYNMTLEYRNKRFSREWVRRFAENLFIIAEGLLSAETIGGIAMLSDADRAVLAGFNDTAVPMDFVPVQEQIHRRALAAPDQTAVAAAGSSLTFRELDLLSGRIGDALRALGVRADTLVGVLFDREVRAYAAEIGILKAGGAFVPFIPDYPDDRIDFCMKDGNIPFLLTTEDIRAKRPALAAEGYRVLTVEELAGDAAEPLPPAEPAVALPGNLAYCIYTSGTTGRPKGVMIEHGNIANYVHRNEKSVEIMHYAAPGRTCLALASFSFDVSVVEEFVPLCNGNTVVIATEEEIHTPDLLAALIRKHGVTGITCTPTYLLSLLDIPSAEEALRGITFFDIGAEAFPMPLYDRLRALRPDSVILNVYGPTEATMGCAAEVMDGSRPVTVGPPIANTEFFVADPFGNELPAGIRGELMICGAQVGRGYISLPEKTAESFFAWHGKRAYRSGDLAAWTEDGKIRIFGRVDNQIKLRGFRIELDEIEKVMSEVPVVKAGAVAVRKNNGSEYLIGYYTSPSDTAPETLKRYMQEKLPEYMVPSALIRLEEMPVNANGKVDRKALPAPDFSSFRAPYAPPETPVEKTVCRAFAAALKLDEASVGTLDDFFELGGDSLKAMAVLAEAGLDGLNAADVFQKRTPRAIAEELAKRAGQESLPEREAKARLVPHRLSSQQLMMIDNQLFRPGSAMWSNMHFLVRFPDVDAEKLCDAVNRALRNHPGLSVAFFFDENNELVQQYRPGLLPEVQVRDLLPETEDSLGDFLLLPFNRILNACLCKVNVFRGRKGCYLFMDISNMLIDGASLGVLLADVMNAYFGRELKPDYYFAMLADAEERNAAGRLEQDRKWFLDRYGDPDDRWCIAPEPDRESRDISLADRIKRLSFDAEQVAAAEEYWGVSHSVMAISAGLIALSRFTGKKHVMINWIFNNRLAPESENAVGMLIRGLPAAARMEEFSSTRKLLQSVKEQVAEGIAHNECDNSFDRFESFLNEYMEVDLQLGINGDELAGLPHERIELDDPFPVSGALIAMDLLENEFGDGGFDSEIEYAEGFYDKQRMEAFQDLYVSLLEAMIRMEDVL